MEPGPLIGRPGLSHGGQASHIGAGPLIGRQASHMEARPLTERPDLSQGGRASHKEAGPLTK